jgi:putative transposase
VKPRQRHNTPIILFVTLAIQPRQPFLANAALRDAFVAACADADAWSVGFYLIMPDHVHLFCRPALEPRVAIERWTQYLRERITKRLRAQSGSAQPRPPCRMPGPLAPLGSTQACPPERMPSPMEGEAAPSRIPWRWQSDCWDTQMRSGEHYREKWEYVRLHPVRKDLVQSPDDWPWQGVLNALERKGTRRSSRMCVPQSPQTPVAVRWHCDRLVNLERNVKHSQTDAEQRRAWSATVMRVQGNLRMRECGRWGGPGQE